MQRLAVQPKINGTSIGSQRPNSQYYIPYRFMVPSTFHSILSPLSKRRNAYNDRCTKMKCLLMYMYVRGGFFFPTNILVPLYCFVTPSMRSSYPCMHSSRGASQSRKKPFFPCQYAWEYWGRKRLLKVCTTGKNRSQPRSPVIREADVAGGVPALITDLHTV